MKSSLIRLCFTILLTGVIAFSCNKKAINENNIPDFATLSSKFKEPPKEYTTAPFFVWNGKITNDEIDKYLTGFKEAGSSQVFIHPRPGLITEYLSENWFDLYKHAVEKGKELGMNVWIYDENSYPSGFGGGHVPDEMPESYNQGQGLKMTRVETLPDTIAKYFLILKEEDGKFADITSALTAEKGKTGKYILFSKTYNEKSDWYGGFSYVDLLYAGVTQKFIDVTMNAYKKHLGAEFGKTIPGSFTDEPQIESPDGIRWTPDLFDVFLKKWHYDLRTQLPSLYEETGDWKKVRHNYTETLLQLFIDRWAKPWYAYCDENNLKFTGHYWEHSWPSMEHGGDNMAMYAWSQVPAIDMLFNQFNDSSTNAQFGNVRSVKELASAANQTGRQRKLSETYGGAGWDLSFRDMKRNGDWEYALGVNLMNQHLTYFTLAGARKYDYPPTFDYHEPWWNNYKYINTHFARLSLALSSGLQKNDILILEPTTSAWLYDSYTNPNKKFKEIGQTFQTMITTLEKNQVEYDLGSENIIKDLGSVSGTKMIVGNASYSTVVIPPMMENLNWQTFELLEKFIYAGGKLVIFEPPTMLNGNESDEVKRIFAKYTSDIYKISDVSKGNIEKYLSNNSLKFEDMSGGAIYHHRRILADGQIIFIANSSLTEQANGSIKTRGKGVLEMNTLNGDITTYPGNVTENDLTLAYTIPPAGSLLLYVSDKEVSGFKTQNIPSGLTTIKSNGPATLSRLSDNAMMVDFCDLQLGNELTKDMNIYYASDKVYKYYGFKNGNPWNTSVQFRKNIVDRDTFGTKTGFTATFHFPVSGKFDFSKIKAVVERPEYWNVSVNGVLVKPLAGQWWLDRSFGVFNIGGLVRTGDNTVTITASPMKIHSEIEPVYILGDFSVKPVEKGWSISSAPPVLSLGSWKDQGLPLYSWGMSYSEDFNIDDATGRWEVDLGKWNGTMAEVIVNGVNAPVIAFPPYQSDITGLVKPGLNKVTINVIGSLKNLLGPHHNNPKTGFVSPWVWRNVKTYPSGDEYQMIDYGLMEDFTVRHGE